MGMYDRVIIEYPVEGLPEGMQFQTHSLDCGMQEYTITKEGRLVVATHDVTLWGKPGRAYADIDFDGDLYLHAKGGLEIRVRFTDGVVTQVKKTGGG